MKTGDATFGVDKTLDQEVDLAVAPKPDHLPGQLDFQPVTQTPLVFIAPVIDCPIRHQLAAGAIDWSSLPLVLPEMGLSRKRVDAWFKKGGLVPNIQAEVAGHEAIVSMVGLGVGVGVIPQLVLDHNPMAKNIEILRQAPTLPDYLVGLVVLEKKLKDPVIKAFWEVTQGLAQVEAN